MFRESKTARTLLRASVVGLLALLATLRASIGDGLDSAEWVDLVQNTIVAMAAYLGIGAASGSVEPYFGRDLKDVEVPMPPAQPEN